MPCHNAHGTLGTLKQDASTSDRGSLTAGRLVRRWLAHRRGQALLVILVSALISGTAVFVAGYQRQVQQAIVDSTFSVDSPGNAWSIGGKPDASLLALVPPSLQRLTRPPVFGRSAVVSWQSDRFPGPPIEGEAIWRTDLCAHVVLASGRCPAGNGQVAVSTADAATYQVRVGDQLPVVLPFRAPVSVTVTGIYRVDQPEDPYWFGNAPVGLSRLSPDEALGDALLATNDWFTRPVGARRVDYESVRPAYQETLDLRVDPAAVGLDDLDDLRSGSAAFADAAKGQARLVSGVPDSLRRIAQEQLRAVTGLTLSLVQLGVLVAVVLTLLTSVELAAQRAELGLARLRGERAVQLRRLAGLRWAVVVGLGWLLGWLPGLGLLALAATLLPGRRGLLPGPALVGVPVVALLLMVAVIAPPARAMLAQPVVALLRSAPTAVRASGGRSLLVDVVLLVLTVSGLLVALQVGTSSVLGLLVPSLLAVGLGVVLFRAIVGRAGRRRRRLAVHGRRPAALLQAIVTGRVRGLRLLVIGTTLAAAFAVFAVQLQTIGNAVRRHDAEVSTGAAAVVRVNGDPSTVRRTLARLDPGSGTADAAMTVVVTTRRGDDRALRGMFVEPAAFPAVAYGADLTTDAATWARLAAPRVDPLDFTAEALTAQIGAHPRIGRTTDPLTPPVRTGRRAELIIDYLDTGDVRRSTTIGALSLAASDGQRLRRPIPCQTGCRLLRIAIEADGPMEGRAPITLLGSVGGSQAVPIDLGPADRWSVVPPANPDDRLELTAGGGGLVLTTTSVGTAAVQRTWVPLVPPVLVAADARAETLPTLSAPDGTQVAVDPVASAVDAVPQQLSGVAVGDLESMLRAGYAARLGARVLVEVWVAPDAVGRLPELTDALAEQGVAVVRTRTSADAVVTSRSTASALSGQIGPGLAVLAGVFAALGVALTVASQRSVLGRDLAGLRLAGLRETTGRRAATSAYLVPGLLAVLAGTLAGAVGCALVVPDLPIRADPQPAIAADLRLHVAALAGTVALAAGVVTVVVLWSVRRLVRSFGLDRLRESA